MTEADKQLGIAICKRFPVDLADVQGLIDMVRGPSASSMLWYKLEMAAAHFDQVEDPELAEACREALRLTSALSEKKACEHDWGVRTINGSPEPGSCVKCGMEADGTYPRQAQASAIEASRDRVAAIRDEVRLFVNDDGRDSATINQADYEWLLKVAEGK